MLKKEFLDDLYCRKIKVEKMLAEASDNRPVDDKFNFEAHKKYKEGLQARLDDINAIILEYIAVHGGP